MVLALADQQAAKLGSLPLIGQDPFRSDRSRYAPALMQSSVEHSACAMP